MDNKELFIHIGFPKTATTTLQDKLFPYHKELIVLTSKNIPFKNLIFSRENYIKNHIDQYKKSLCLYLQNNKKKYIYSEESLTSFSMYFKFEPTPYIWTIEPNSIARKLKYIFVNSKLFDKIKIIVTIRKQDDIIKSMYVQVYNIVFKKFKQTNKFNKFIQYSLQNRDQFILDAIDYNSVIKTYEELFGKENICILIFEELKQNKNSFIRKLCNFMEIDYNETIKLLGCNHINKRNMGNGIYKTDERRISEILRYYKTRLGIGNLRLSNNFIFKLLDNIYIPSRKLKIEISKEYEKQLEEIYKKGNRELSQRYNLDLKRWGYYYE